jgi:hypothetical protein
MKSLILLGLMILFTITSSLAYSIQDENSILDRSPASEPEIQDSQGRQLSYILVDQQVLIVADVTNALGTQQPFTYFVQIQDDTGAVVSLGWLSGTLSPNQMLSPALSWTPVNPGTFKATVFVWEGIDNPSALSPSISIDIDVRLAEV